MARGNVEEPMRRIVSSFCAASLLCAALHAADQPEKGSDGSIENDPDIALAFKLERAFQKLAKRVAPCVVSLQVSARTKDWSDELHRMGERLGPSALDRTFEGSGVIIDPAGWIITNEHVVREADSIMVKFSDGRVCTAAVTGLDRRSDLAMIKLTGDGIPTNLSVAELADSEKVQVGQYSMAVGNPFGLSNSFTLGVISARGRNRQGLSSEVFYGNLIQTDTSINPGNSGGPLFDLSGKIIGINTMIFSLTGSSQGCGFAIPSNHLKPRLAYLKIGREIEYGWLGVALKDILPFQKEFKIPDNKGVLVDSVISNTPADRAGLTHGMVILDFDGTRVGSRDELIAVVSATTVGSKVKVKVLDSTGKVTDLSVRISKRNADLAQARVMHPNLDLENQALDLDEIAGGNATPKDALGKPDKIDKPAPYVWRGMQVKELSADEGKKKNGRLEITRVKTGSPADRAGLYEGAILTEWKDAGDVAIKKLDSLDALRKLAATAPGPVALYTQIDGYVTVDEK